MHVDTEPVDQTRQHRLFPCQPRCAWAWRPREHARGPPYRLVDPFRVAGSAPDHHLDIAERTESARQIDRVPTGADGPGRDSGRVERELQPAARLRTDRHRLSHVLLAA